VVPVTWLLYGATGYTAGLVLERARQRGHAPVLAARREAAVRPLAEAAGLPWRAFALDQPGAVDRGLEGMRAAVNLAGPFRHTARPLFEACLRLGVPYLDIGGEVRVYEALLARGAEARAAQVAAVLGVGFDVVPSDCVAAMLKAALPGAVELELAFGGFGRSGPSRGSLHTLLETLGEGALIREGGRLRRVPFSWRRPRVRFPQGEARCLTVPWGEVVTAFATTGIPDIAVYLAAPPGLGLALAVLRPLLRLAWVRRLLRQMVAATVVGPGLEQRRASSAAVWGRARDAGGHEVALSLSAPEGYTLTADSTVAALERVLAGEVPPGVWTPALAFGKDFVRELPGVEVGPLTGSSASPRPAPAPP
jgi:short subunit dehydrogenase-like uncharacterized protein